MAEKITEKKELYDEFRLELQKRRVITSLAAKEVFFEFLKTRVENNKSAHSF